VNKLLTTIPKIGNSLKKGIKGRYKDNVEIKIGNNGNKVVSNQRYIFNIG
jgi:hypothetical protein